MQKNEETMKIAIISGSPSDQAVIDAADSYLAWFGLQAERRILSAHRTPEELKRFIQDFDASGGQIYIGVAGMAAHLAGVIASHTARPVLGVPTEGPSLGGLDSLLSMVQMPRGVPVATFAIGKAGMINAVIFAAQMLSLQDASLREKLDVFKSGGCVLP